MPKISIRTNILLVFLLLLSIISISLLYSHYYFSKKIALSATADTFKLIAKHVENSYQTKETYTLEELNNFLQNQARILKGTEIFVYNEKGFKIASSNAAAHKTLPIMLNKKLFEFLQKSRVKQLLVYDSKERYSYLIYKKINKNTYLAIRTDAMTLLKPYKENLLQSLFIAALLLLLSIPFILYAAQKIVKPVQALVRENNKIKNRNFEAVKGIETNIIEFQELSDSLVSMSQSIYSYQKAQEELLDSIVKLIAEAVDAKSHYTGGHCERVPEIALMLADAAEKSNTPAFKDFHFKDENAKKEFALGAWLHDCGKVTTPEYVVDKATKLETIHNRIHEIRTRFEVLYRDAEIEYLQECLTANKPEKALKKKQKRQRELLEDFAFVAAVNIGGEYLDEAKKERIKEIAEYEWLRHFDDRLGLSELELSRYSDTPVILPIKEKLLDDKPEHIVQRDSFDYEAYKKEGFKMEVPKYLYNYGEIYNLCIEKGTLTQEERYKINEHVIMSIKMLEKIPFPSYYAKVPEYAGTHHERLNGTGYPRKLTAAELSIPSRIMALADIFEALTASDRPYKRAKTLSESIEILSYMVKEEHIDRDIFRLFLSSGVYLSYAKRFLSAEQIDNVEIKKYL